ncbi:MAG: RnfABCDGE type electron transport complex subunit D [Erysipelotrichaceae bacterium]|nr:RnfABCDGE type electron transport complex subunit D [Erysipelotrichaceae bacterium]
MNYLIKPASPSYKRRRRTRDIMKELLIGLYVLAVYAVGFQLFVFGWQRALRVLAIFVLATLTSLATEVIWGRMHESDFQKIMEKQFPLITPIIYAFTLPATTPFYIVMLGAFLATFFGKLVYGGFGQNIFNPALVGRVIIHLSFPTAMKPTVMIDGMTSATPASALASANWFYNHGYVFNVMDIVKGTYGGAIVETCVIPIIIVAICLSIRQIYDLRLSLSFLGTVAVIALFMGLVMGVNPVTNMAIHLCLGGLIFGAFFMASDPVTTPTSPFGKILFGIGMGFMTMLIRTKANYPEGVLISILIFNMLVPLFDGITMGRTDRNLIRRYILLVAAVALATIIICIIVSGFEPVAAFSMIGGVLS